MITTHIQGIPCQVQVTTYTNVKGSRSYNAPSDLDYYGYTEVEFDVHDRKGYRAPWLEKKMTEDDYDRIRAEVVEYMSEDCDD